MYLKIWYRLVLIGNEVNLKMKEREKSTRESTLLVGHQSGNRLPCLHEDNSETRQLMPGQMKSSTDINRALVAGLPVIHGEMAGEIIPYYIDGGAACNRKDGDKPGTLEENI